MLCKTWGELSMFLSDHWLIFYIYKCSRNTLGIWQYSCNQRKTQDTVLTFLNLFAEFWMTFPCLAWALEKTHSISSRLGGTWNFFPSLSWFPKAMEATSCLWSWRKPPLSLGSQASIDSLWSKWSRIFIVYEESVCRHKWLIPHYVFGKNIFYYHTSKLPRAIWEGDFASAVMHNNAVLWIYVNLY